ncbi:thioredoxin family protein [Bacillus shivajii]|uniref:thioredoxin family protein n=1 Tax=Bacillus shivajii TaxID=1983719 RepID=UPI001CFAD351|nr:thioredoxin family protein [Bacillus shivajii]UCZ52322.1 thioredoxin family protein [Bacillus shivajii]
MKEIISLDHFNEVVENENAVLMFTAGWCPDCVVIEPHLPEVEERFKEFSFYKVNRDEFIEQCQQYDIFGIPSFLVFKNGQEIDRFVSKARKSKEDIIQFLDEAKQK